MVSSEIKTVALAGATGFVGSALLPELAKNYKVIALTRGRVKEQTKADNNIIWRQCDLFSLLETERALEGVDAAIYLIHSMLPSAELSQGEFQNFDLLVADNFARASANKGLKQLVYLGGMIPEGEDLSSHLRSRKEVEKALASRGVPLTVLRAAMILGPGGSSITIMLRLVRRLPAMLCPSWTETKTQPIYLDDVVAGIVSVLGEKSSFTESYDLAGPTVLTYKEMMQEAASVMKLKRFILSIPVFSPVLSGFWLKLVTGAPLSLTAPLVSSLGHEMIPRPGKRLELGDRSFLDFRTSLAQSLQGVNTPRSSPPRAFTLPEDERRKRTVRSVQRLELPQGATAPEVAAEYIRWLPEFLGPALKVVVDGGRVDFRIPILNISLLVIELSEERSISDRQLFYIVGGALAQSVQNDRIEFRETYDKKNIIVAVHDFKPALPWYFYKFTQAVLHAFVMKRFGKHLRAKG